MNEGWGQVHYWIDMLVEIPVRVGVVCTGTWPLASVPWDLAIRIKVACALGAVGAYAYRVGVVVRRARSGDLSLRRSVYGSAVVGVPLALAALALGLARGGP